MDLSAVCKWTGIICVLYPFDSDTHGIWSELLERIHATEAILEVFGAATPLIVVAKSISFKQKIL